MDKLYRKIWKDFGEKRENQLEIAGIVDETLRLEGKYSIITSPPGTGKTVGYLVPAIQYSIETGQPVVISTATKSLQDQILHDTQSLKKYFKPEIKAAILKGKRNYLDCGRLYDYLSENLIKDKVDGVDISKFLQWTKTTETGDLSTVKIPDALPESAYNNGSDFYERALNEAANANIIITNHSVILMQAKMNQMKRDYLPWKLIQNIIFDEADGFYRSMKNIFSTTVAMSRLRRLTAIAETLTKSHAKDMSEIRDQFNSLMIRSREIKNGDSFRIGKSRERLNQFREIITEMKAGIEKCIDVVKHSHTSKHVTRSIVLSEFREKKDNLCLLLEKTYKNPNALLMTYSPVYHYPSLEYEGSVKMSAINKYLWGGLHAVCFISATIYEPPYFLRKIGIPYGEKLVDMLSDWGISTMENHKTVALKSPFLFRATVFYPPEEWPCPEVNKNISANREYLKNLSAMIIDSIKNGRNSLVLFGSHNGINQYIRYVRENEDIKKTLLADCNIINASGNIKFPEVLSSIKTGKNVILGTGDYWVGKDFPKGSIQSVVIAKLPFAQSFSEDKIEFDKDFMHDILPEAVIRFNQGCGRLIRGADYTGTVYIADSRIVTKNYGSRFRKYLEQNFESFCAFGQDTQARTMEARGETISEETVSAAAVS